jgi:predicted GIY-YIG superfamily endonuclease
MARTYYVYILASESRELYVGVTNDIYQRVWQHRSGLDPNSYSARHRTFRLVSVKAPQMCSLGSDERSRSRAGAGEGGWS